MTALHAEPPPAKNEPPTQPVPLLRLNTLPVDVAPVIVIPGGALTCADTYAPPGACPLGSPLSTNALEH